MMKLGFVSAIVGELTLEEVFAFAAAEGFGCVELMCWPPGKADRRYAGVTHLDVTQFGQAEAIAVQGLVKKYGIAISGLGYYPNPLDPNPDHRHTVVEHLKKVMNAAVLLGVPVVNTFIGRDPAQSIDANLMILPHIWNPLVEHARNLGLKIGIEHCPMLFSNDEWPGGKNLAISPAVWRKLFEMYPDGTLGLNFDPSHLIWQFIDTRQALKEFGPRIVHVHAKDETIDKAKLHDVGILGLGWHQPKLPGLGDVKWGEFFSALSDTGYKGSVCIEVEDRAFETNLDEKKWAVRQSKKYLEQYLVK
jgi:sugar phosphate isomerase/epimerase